MAASRAWSSVRVNDWRGLDIEILSRSHLVILLTKIYHSRTPNARAFTSKISVPYLSLAGAPPRFSVDAATGKVNNLHSLLSTWEFLDYGLMAALIAILIA
jgi:hypothetical protein